MTIPDSGDALTSGVQRTYYDSTHQRCFVRNGRMVQEPAQTSPTSSISTSTWIHLGLLLTLGLAGLTYWWLTPPSLDPVTDPQAAKALAMVQTHRALGYPTILQAFNEHVRAKSERGEGIRLGEWRVISLDPDLYEVRVNLREQGTNQWFEREYIWHVHLETGRVNAASLPADGLMPPGPEVPAPLSSSPSS